MDTGYKNNILEVTQLNKLYARQSNIIFIIEFESQNNPLLLN